MVEGVCDMEYRVGGGISSGYGITTGIGRGGLLIFRFVNGLLFS